MFIFPSDHLIICQRSFKACSLLPLPLPAPPIQYLKALSEGKKLFFAVNIDTVTIYNIIITFNNVPVRIENPRIYFLYNPRIFRQ